MKSNNRQTMEEIVRLRPWFHNLHLPDGEQTAPDHFLGDFPSSMWRQMENSIPARLDGWTVLDVGCNAGFYSFELALRGAQVTGIDLNPHYLSQARWAAARYGVENAVTFHQMQVYDLARTNTQYDLVLFLGVFYHLRYPLLGMDIVSKKVKRLMVFQTLTMPGDEVFDTGTDREINDREIFLDPGWPKMAFIEHRFSNDPTNWWSANHAGVLAMLRSSGLKVIDRPGTEIYICVPNPENPSSTVTWNSGEYLSAIGQGRADRSV